MADAAARPTEPARPTQPTGPTQPRAHDVVVYGATGFVGRLTPRHLATAAPAGTRVALAGRSRDKLERARQDLGVDWPLIVADSADGAAVAELAASTRVVATTVGPYGKYGKALAAACADAGTSYADLTGEVFYVRWCADHLHDRAAATGARIVNSCGYDSIPSDLGVLLLAERAHADGAGDLEEVVLVAKGKGGVSGGTVDSLRVELDAKRADPSGASLVADPYSLSPDREAEADLGPQPDTFLPHRDPLIGEWVAPFVMAGFNTRIVRRSNALTGWSYGRGLRYREVMAFGSSPVGAAMAGGLTAGMAVAMAAMANDVSRGLLDRVLPKPGEGPSQATMDAGSFRSELHARTTSGRRYRAVVAGAGDPGYKATAVMFGEAALALAGAGLPDSAGVLTPATAMGDALVARLRAAGLTLDVVPVDA
ncbi:MAG TPA: saccharopine dehydrogenase NADP-binding domain-containing protein [Acidimicrobiales bacterium]|nr:saccharopine dehydrogenase NADP-binding domain-containing protein [Acidimicrobiales bacterium]